MLSIRVRYGEKIQIGNATIVVKFISSKKAQLVIDAPKDVAVIRETAKKKDGQ